MFESSVEDIFYKKQSRYSLVIAIAKRAREILDESEKNHEPLIEKPVSLAVRDFKERKYRIIEPERRD